MVKSTFKFHRPSQIPLPIVKVNGQVNTKQSSIFQGNNQPFDLSLSVLALWAKARPKKLQRIQIIRPLGSSTLSCCQIAKAPQERLCRISRSFSCNLLQKWEYKKSWTGNFSTGFLRRLCGQRCRDLVLRRYSRLSI